MKTAKLAAQIWADKIGGKQDNGVDMHNMLLTLNSTMSGPVTEDQKNRFRVFLADRLKDKVNGNHPVILSVDYHPDALLLEACNVAGIPTAKLPVKSVVWVYEDRVMHAFGYRAERITVYPTE